jgi:hypothetical protein
VAQVCKQALAPSAVLARSTQAEPLTQDEPQESEQ